MGALQDLPNIGQKLEEQLIKVGIHSYDELKKAGSQEAWFRIKMIDDSACIMRLYALEGAILSIRWKYLDDERKKELKAYYDSVK